MSLVNFLRILPLFYVPYLILVVLHIIQYMKQLLNNRATQMAVIIIVSNITSFLLGGLLIYILNDPVKGVADIVLQTLMPEQPYAGETRVYVSARGKRYYPWWCDAGSRISPENIVWYDTPQEAEGEGYTAAKACI